MRYEKPLALPLSARAVARGDELLSCMGGSSPAGGERVCGAGTDPWYSAGCSVGGSTGDCAGGVAADYTCLAGVTVELGNECSAGTGGASGYCTVGPAADLSA